MIHKMDRDFSKNVRGRWRGLSYKLTLPTRISS